MTSMAHPAAFFVISNPTEWWILRMRGISQIKIKSVRKPFDIDCIHYSLLITFKMMTCKLKDCVHMEKVYLCEKISNLSP